MLHVLLFLPMASTTSKMEPFIVGGQASFINQWPFITFIETVENKNSTPFSACGGSLLSSQTVLTAAHCLDDVTRSKKLVNFYRFNIYMGHSYHNKSKMVRRVRDYETPRFYHPDRLDIRGDIGIMFLISPVKFVRDVQKVILFNRKFSSTRDRNVLVAGWGRTRHGAYSNMSDKLKEVSLTTMTTKECQKEVYYIEATLVVCTAPGKHYAYSGDSGGPLVKKGSRQQLGLVSFRHETTGVTVFTSVPAYYTWIRDTQLKLFKTHCKKGKKGH